MELNLAARSCSLQEVRLCISAENDLSSEAANAGICQDESTCAAPQFPICLFFAIETEVRYDLPTPHFAHLLVTHAEVASGLWREKNGQKIRPAVNEKALRDVLRLEEADGVRCLCTLKWSSVKVKRLSIILQGRFPHCFFTDLFQFIFFPLPLSLAAAHQLLHCAQPLQPLRQWILKPWGRFETRLETRAGEESLMSHRLPGRCHGDAGGLIHFGSVPLRPLAPHAVSL